MPTSKVAAGVLSLALLAGLPAAAGPAHAAPAGGSEAYQCTSTNGVWVTVAVRAVTQVEGCYRGGGTGLDALQAITSVKQKPDGLICRINGFPSGPPEPPICNPADKTSHIFWFYWLKTPKDSAWQFSNWGAQNRNVVPGTIEGWNYGTGLYPPAPPPEPDLSAPAPPPPPPATVAQPTQPSNPAQPPAATQGPASTQRPGSTGAPGSDGEPSRTAAGDGAEPTTQGSATDEQPGASASADASADSATTSSPGADATPSSAASATPPMGGDEGSAADPARAGQPDETGSPVGLLATVGLIAAAALGGGAWWWFRIRPRTHVG